MPDLTSQQRANLRAQAHHLEPLILVGKGGASDALIRAASDALDAHELVKVKFNDHKDEKAELIDQIAFRNNAALVSRIGHTAVFYRPHADPEKRRINPDARR